jgi:hypothetical protein
MARPRITFDAKRGVLRPDLVWQFDHFVRGGEFVYAALGTGAEQSQSRHKCQVDKRHVTRLEYDSIGVELRGPGKLHDLVPMYDEPLTFVTQPFVDRLKESGLTGWSEQDIVRIEWHPPSLMAPRVLYLNVTGSAGRTNRFTVHGAPNLCPHCRRMPMICPGCGANNWPKCEDCDEWTLFLPKVPNCSHPAGFIIEGYPPEVCIVEGKQWDGSDWFHSDGIIFVSNRAKEWLERTHTFPVAFKPALLNIEGVEDKFKK